MAIPSTGPVYVFDLSGLDGDWGGCMGMPLSYEMQYIHHRVSFFALLEHVQRPKRADEVCGQSMCHATMVVQTDARRGYWTGRTEEAHAAATVRGGCVVWLPGYKRRVADGCIDTGSGP